jgi:hypothetical protein
MQKMMQNEMHSERRDVEAWSQKQGINDAAKDELLRILYGKPLLTKERL